MSADKMPLPEAFGWLHDGTRDGSLVFQKTEPKGFQALVVSSMPVYSYAQADACARAYAAEQTRELVEALEKLVGRNLTYLDNKVMGGQIDYAEVAAARALIAKHKEQA